MTSPPVTVTADKLAAERRWKITQVDDPSHPYRLASPVWRRTLGTARELLVWDPDRPATAECRTSLTAFTLGLRHVPGELSPGVECTCGLYASPRGALHWWSDRLGSEVTGDVDMWGRIYRHAAGYRAQHMRVTALHQPPTSNPENHRQVEAVAEVYRVPVVNHPVLSDPARVEPRMWLDYIPVSSLAHPRESYILHLVGSRIPANLPPITVV